MASPPDPTFQRVVDGALTVKNKTLSVTVVNSHRATISAWHDVPLHASDGSLFVVCVKSKGQQLNCHVDCGSGKIVPSDRADLSYLVKKPLPYNVGIIPRTVSHLHSGDDGSRGSSGDGSKSGLTSSMTPGVIEEYVHDQKCPAGATCPFRCSQPLEIIDVSNQSRQIGEVYKFWPITAIAYVDEGATAVLAGKLQSAQREAVLRDCAMYLSWKIVGVATSDARPQFAAYPSVGIPLSLLQSMSAFYFPKARSKKSLAPIEDNVLVAPSSNSALHIIAECNTEWQNKIITARIENSGLGSSLVLAPSRTKEFERNSSLSEGRREEDASRRESESNTSTGEFQSPRLGSSLTFSRNEVVARGGNGRGDARGEGGTEKGGGKMQHGVLVVEVKKGAARNEAVPKSPNLVRMESMGKGFAFTESNPALSSLSRMESLGTGLGFSKFGSDGLGATANAGGEQAAGKVDMWLDATVKLSSEQRGVNGAGTPSSVNVNYESDFPIGYKRNSIRRGATTEQDFAPRPGPVVGSGVAAEAGRRLASLRRAQSMRVGEGVDLAQLSEAARNGMPVETGGPEPGGAGQPRRRRVSVDLDRDPGVVATDGYVSERPVKRMPRRTLSIGPLSDVNSFLADVTKGGEESGAAGAGEGGVVSAYKMKALDLIQKSTAFEEVNVIQNPKLKKGDEKGGQKNGEEKGGEIGENKGEPGEGGKSLDRQSSSSSNLSLSSKEEDEEGEEESAMKGAETAAAREKKGAIRPPPGSPLHESLSLKSPVKRTASFDSPRPGLREEVLGGARSFEERGGGEGEEEGEEQQRKHFVRVKTISATSAVSSHPPSPSAFKKKAGAVGGVGPGTGRPKSLLSRGAGNEKGEVAALSTLSEDISEEAGGYQMGARAYLSDMDVGGSPRASETGTTPTSMTPGPTNFRANMFSAAAGGNNSSPPLIVSPLAGPSSSKGGAVTRKVAAGSGGGSDSAGATRSYVRSVSVMSDAEAALQKSRFGPNSNRSVSLGAGGNVKGVSLYPKPEAQFQEVEGLASPVVVAPIQPGDWGIALGGTGAPVGREAGYYRSVSVQAPDQGKRTVPVNRNFNYYDGFDSNDSDASVAAGGAGAKAVLRKKPGFAGQVPGPGPGVPAGVPKVRKVKVQGIPLHASEGGATPVEAYLPSLEEDLNERMMDAVTGGPGMASGGLSALPEGSEVTVMSTVRMKGPGGAGRGAGLVSHTSLAKPKKSPGPIGKSLFRARTQGEEYYSTEDESSIVTATEYIRASQEFPEAPVVIEVPATGPRLRTPPSASRAAARSGPSDNIPVSQPWALHTPPGSKPGTPPMMGMIPAAGGRSPPGAPPWQMAEDPAYANSPIMSPVMLANPTVQRGAGWGPTGPYGGPGSMGHNIPVVNPGNGVGFGEFRSSSFGGRQGTPPERQISSGASPYGPGPVAVYGPGEEVEEELMLRRANTYATQQQGGRGYGPPSGARRSNVRQSPGHGRGNVPTVRPISSGGRTLGQDQAAAVMHVARPITAEAGARPGGFRRSSSNPAYEEIDGEGLEDMEAEQMSRSYTVSGPAVLKGTKGGMMSQHQQQYGGYDPGYGAMEYGQDGGSYGMGMGDPGTSIPYHQQMDSAGYGGGRYKGTTGPQKGQRMGQRGNKGAGLQRPGSRGSGEYGDAYEQQQVNNSGGAAGW